MNTSSKRDEYAQHILRSYHNLLLVKYPRGLPEPVLRIPEPHGSPPRIVTVAIIGAGVAGLFAGLTLHLLKRPLLEANVIIDYTILESQPADGDHPVGGRLRTHAFDGQVDDYYDRGAMRYPEVDFMQPVFDLFKKLGINDLRIPYYMEDDAGNNVNFFNGIRKTNKDLASEYKLGHYDPFQTNILGLYASPKTMMDDQIKGYKLALIANSSEGWNNLMKVDGWSTRGYLTYEGTGGKTWSPDVIDYMETIESGTSMWNAAFSETVMDSLDFDYPTDDPNERVKWWCIHGGSNIIANKMAEQIPSGIIQNGKHVTRIRAAGTDGFEVTCDDSPPTTYNHVITTIPFGCLRAVDTSNCDFGYMLNTAIRMLQYDASTKVAIKFTTRWWEGAHINGYKCTVGDQMGGVSSTDRPTRMVVYPSYGMGGTTGATMIVSYTWSQDALRFSSLCRGNKSPEEESLKALILRDLTDIHGIVDKNGNTDYDYLASLVDNDTYDAWSWYNAANASGAYALFGPGQFSGLYTQVTKPVRGMFHFAGEATSTHHGWVLGAINSAARVLQEIGVHEGIDALSGGVHNLWPNIKEFEKDLLIRQVALGQAEEQM